MSVTYKNLYSQVNNLIDARIKYNGALPYKNQQSHQDIAPFTLQSTGGNVSANELIGAVMQILMEVVPPRILVGLEVEATTPISSDVIVRAGKGTSKGSVYELLEDVTVNIPLSTSSPIYYINLYPTNVIIETMQNHLTVAKIVVPKPSFTSLIQDTSDGGWNAYIQSFKEYRLFGFNDKFEEDTQALLRDNIGDILADNLIGNIRLSENLKITNTAGTLELDSNQLLLKDYNDTIITKLNHQGVYFYNETGYELAKFTTTEARIGNMSLLPNSIQSNNYVPLVSGFQIKDTGDAEFNQLTVRGTVYATAGEIGGWSIASNSIYGTTTGTIKTGANVGIGQNGVILDTAGIRVYDDVLGVVVNLPSDGSAPTFSSGIINSTIFVINTSAVLRTSETVGDGSANSAGLLINPTGLYACEANQTLASANLKVLATGDAYFKGTITATSGQIGSVLITPTQLTGGLIVGSEIIGAIIETSNTVPRIRMDSSGVYYQVTSAIGKYDTFKYNDGTKYGSGVSAYLFNPSYPNLAIVAETDMADIRLYNRTLVPSSGTHVLGDIIVVAGELKICSIAGTPGTFVNVGTTTFLGLSDTPDSYSGQGGKTVVVNSGGTALEFASSYTPWTDESGYKISYTLGPVALNTLFLDTVGTMYKLSDNFIIQSLTSNKDMLFYVNVGGTHTNSARFHGDTGYFQLNQHMDFNQKEAISFVLENRTTDPSSPVSGQMWIRTDLL